MRNPGGELIEFGPYAEKHTDTFTCFHCQRVTFVKPYQDPASIGAVCKVCMKLICVRCADARDRGVPCNPWLEQMEEQEAKERTRRSLGI